MSQDFVNVPIPVDRIQEVYELLARRKGQPAAPAPARTPAQTEPVDRELLIRAYRESPGAMKKVFDHLAANADRDVPMSELAKAVGYHPHQMAGALGAFGRRWKNRYHGGGDAKWPFSAVWDFGSNMVIYSMSADAAEVIKGI